MAWVIGFSLTKKCTCALFIFWWIEHRRHSRWFESSLQDGMGNSSTSSGEDGCRSWGLHRSKPVFEHPHCWAQLWEANLYAFLCLEIGNLKKMNPYIIDTSYFPSSRLKGLKTGMYYLRTKPAASAIQFTVDKSKLKKTSEVESSLNGSAERKANDQRRNMEEMVCSLQNKEDCLMCGSWIIL